MGGGNNNGWQLLPHVHSSKVKPDDTIIRQQPFHGASIQLEVIIHHIAAMKAANPYHWNKNLQNETSKGGTKKNANINRYWSEGSYQRGKKLMDGSLMLRSATIGIISHRKKKTTF